MEKWEKEFEAIIDRINGPESSCGFAWDAPICDFKSWFKTAWDLQEHRVKELENKLELVRFTLEGAACFWTFHTETEDPDLLRQLIEESKEFAQRDLNEIFGEEK